MPFESRELTLRGVLSVETRARPGLSVENADALAGSKYCSPTVKLHFYDALESTGRDGTFFDLQAAVPPSPGFAVPYSAARSAADRGLGLRGTAKLSLPAARGAQGARRKARMLAYATSIVRHEVEPETEHETELEHENRGGPAGPAARIPGMAEAEVRVRTRRWQLRNGAAGVALDILALRPLFVRD